MRPVFGVISPGMNGRRGKKGARSTSDEDYEIVITLKNLERELRSIYSSLDYVTDPSLIDSYVFELQAVHKRYEYYIKLCKDRGVAASVC